MNALRKIRESERKNVSKSQLLSKKVDVYTLRILKEWNEWEEIPGVTIDFPYGVEKTHIFDVTIFPHSGYWKDGKFRFHFEIPSDYPMSPPDVTCQNIPIYHPNIDVKGNVCLNILRTDWTAVSTFGNVIYGLILLFENPNFSDPLPSGVFPKSMEPHEVKARDENKFKNLVNMTMKGGEVNGLGDILFACVL